MSDLKELIEKNRAWSERIKQENPDFFRELSEQQSPQYLWIGCSDSRVPCNQIVDLMPGELFVHRNIANVMVHTDLNSLSVIQYAVDVLEVKHIIVCGHYGCGGVNAVLEGGRVGLADNWLGHVYDVKDKHRECLDAAPDDETRLNLLCELNVIEQVQNVCRTTVVRDAWERGQELSVHGWIYGLKDGRVRELQTSVKSAEEQKELYQAAVENIAR